MTRATARQSRFTATIWPAGTVNEWGAEVSGVPYTVECCYQEGGNRTATASDGTQFKPMLMIWFELTATQPRPEEDKQCYVAIGDHSLTTNPSAAGAKLIKSNNVTPWLDSSQNPDVELAC